MNKFLKEFKDRGYFYQCTNEEDLSKLLEKEKIKGYIGFDCTASSLHVGSLLQIMCLKLLQKHGHQPIVLLGGGTTRIGDPSGKEETRKILLKYRKPTTPVAIIKGAFRESETVVMTDLEHMENYADKLGMISTVIIGNSSTYNFKDLMINPRGYKSKYNLEEPEIKN